MVDLNAFRPVKPVATIMSVNVKDYSITLANQTKRGVFEHTLKLADDAKILLDGKSARLVDVPKWSIASVVVSRSMDGTPDAITELHVSTTDDKLKPDKYPSAPPSQTLYGTVKSVNGNENTVTIAFHTDNGVLEKVVKLGEGGKVFIDGKSSKLANVPKGTVTWISLPEGEIESLVVVAELRITGPYVSGIVTKVDLTSITITSDKVARTFKVVAAGTIIVNGFDAKPTNIKVGHEAQLRLTADGSAAISINANTKPIDMSGSPQSPQPGK